MITRRKLRASLHARLYSASSNIPPLEEAKTYAPEVIAAHVKRSKELHEVGTLLIAAAFLDESDEQLRTMAVTISREAAEEYVKGDPFFLNCKMSERHTREWATMFARS